MDGLCEMAIMMRLAVKPKVDFTLILIVFISIAKRDYLPIDYRDCSRRTGKGGF